MIKCKIIQVMTFINGDKRLSMFEINGLSYGVVLPIMEPNTDIWFMCKYINLKLPNLTNVKLERLLSIDDIKLNKKEFKRILNRTDILNNRDN